MLQGFQKLTLLPQSLLKFFVRYLYNLDGHGRRNLLVWPIVESLIHAAELPFTNKLTSPTLLQIFVGSKQQIRLLEEGLRTGVVVWITAFLCLTNGPARTLSTEVQKRRLALIVFKVT